MKVLVLEDRPYTLKNIEEVLLLERHEVILCNTLYEANEQYLLNKDTIDCIITDLYIFPEELTQEDLSESEDGKLAGWLWLSKNVINSHHVIKCIVFSMYIDFLKQYLARRDQLHMLNDVTLIPKGGIDSFETLAIAVLKSKFDSDVKSRKDEKSLFLSYCSLDSDIVDIVEKALYRHFGDKINVARYTRNVNYRDSFKEFMRTIYKHDFVVSVVSSNYLKSHACMYEVGEIIRIPDFQKKLLFIVLSDQDKGFYKMPPSGSIAANVYNPIARNEHILFWKEKYEKIRECQKLLGDYVVNDDLEKSLHETKKILDNDIQQF